MRRAAALLVAVLALLATATAEGRGAAGAKRDRCAPRAVPACAAAARRCRPATSRRCARLAAGIRGAGRPVVFRPVASSPAGAAPSAAAPSPGGTPSATAPAAGPSATSDGVSLAPPEAPAAEGPAAPAPPVAPARLQATAREFSIALSRPTIAAGPLILQLVNRGEDPHDLHVRSGATDVLQIGVADPEGGLGQASGTLAAGTYTLYCSLPGHEALGMKATLHVG